MQVLGRRTGPWLRLWLRARLAESPPRQGLSGHLIALISGLQDPMGSRTRWAIQEVWALDIPFRVLWGPPVPDTWALDLVSASLRLPARALAANRHGSCSILGMAIGPSHHRKPSGSGSSRLNLLFSSSWREGVPSAELPRLLDPMGVRCLEARCGRDAADLVAREQIHIALVDLEMPMENEGDPRPAGHRVLQLLRRVDPAPPVVLVRPPQPSRRDSVRGLNDALREGVFAVLDRPLGLESMLETLRRVVRRHYADRWPAA